MYSCVDIFTHIGHKQMQAYFTVMHHSIILLELYNKGMQLQNIKALSHGLPAVQLLNNPLRF